MGFLESIAAEVIAAVLGAGVLAVLGWLGVRLFRRRREDPSPPPLSPPQLWGGRGRGETPPSLPGKGAGGLGRKGAGGLGGEPCPLRVLVAASRPWDAEPWLDTEAEWEALCAVLQPGAEAGAVPIRMEFPPAATPQALCCRRCGSTRR